MNKYNDFWICKNYNEPKRFTVIVKGINITIEIGILIAKVFNKPAPLNVLNNIVYKLSIIKNKVIMPKNTMPVHFMNLLNFIFYSIHKNLFPRSVSLLVKSIFVFNLFQNYINRFHTKLVGKLLYKPFVFQRGYL